MDARQHIFYATGILAYAIAKADGKVQLEEHNELHNIVNEEIGHDIDAQYTEIIFDLLQHDKVGFSGVYGWAIDAFETGKHYLSDELRAKVKRTIARVAEAFNDIDPDEKALIDQFESDLDHLKVNTVIE